jgi:hypothetical protein
MTVTVVGRSFTSMHWTLKMQHITRDKGQGTGPVLQVTHVKYKIDIYRSKICGFHGCDYEEWRLLGCYAAWLL